MRVPCPFCGSRDSREFVVRGDASPQRPKIDSEDAMFEYVYLRDNPAGNFEELWYHAQGCRNWMRVMRNTRTHQIQDASLAQTGWSHE